MTPCHHRIKKHNKNLTETSHRTIPVCIIHHKAVLLPAVDNHLFLPPAENPHLQMDITIPATFILVLILHTSTDLPGTDNPPGLP